MSDKDRFMNLMDSIGVPIETQRVDGVDVLSIEPPEWWRDPDKGKGKVTGSSDHSACFSFDQQGMFIRVSV